VSRSQALHARLERASDWLSPIVVKEVRQMVRGREFTMSLGASLMTGLLVAFYGAADALTGSGSSGRWTFIALMTGLTVLGLGMVPLTAFSALRNERMEQTLELITLTALSPRRIVIGKLLAQGVKLVTIFAAVAPFITMTFLLGGIDFVTILVSVGVVFIWSLWCSAACLFLSTLLKSRAMSGLVFGGTGFILLLVFVVGRGLFFVASRGAFAVGPGVMFGVARSDSWWALAITTSAWLVTIANLVLLAENRLSLPTEDRSTALRAGFLVQFLTICGWTLSFINEPETVRSTAIDVLGVIGGLHLALVAMFAVTEDLVVPRRVLLQLHRPSSRRWLLAIFRPGGGRGAIYVLVQMALLVLTAWLLEPSWTKLRWVMAICAYICFFTGVPALAFRLVVPPRIPSMILRAGVLLLLPLSMLLPDMLYYVFWLPEAFDIRFAARHLINPLRTLANWTLVETRGWIWMPVLLGLSGLLAYLLLFQIGSRTTAELATDLHEPSAAGAPGSAHVLY
jgi:hypothetical protein